MALAAIPAIEVKISKLFLGRPNSFGFLPMRNRNLLMRPRVVEVKAKVKGKGNTRTESAKIRNRRFQKKFNGSSRKPRLSVFCSDQQLYAMLVDDQNKKCLYYGSTLQKSIRGEPPCSKMHSNLKMATIAAGVNLSTPRGVVLADTPKAQTIRLNHPWKMSNQFGSGVGRRMCVRPVAAAPDKITEKVQESIKAAQEKCSEDPVSGECVAAWDEVEELSAAASHARDKKKDSDPLEAYCKDNPETDECRTYED